jgi:hypothetical protein
MLVAYQKGTGPLKNPGWAGHPKRTSEPLQASLDTLAELAIMATSFFVAEVVWPH